MWATARETLPSAKSDKLIGAIADYVFTGVSPDWLPSDAMKVFVGLEPALKKYRRNAVNGMHNGKSDDLPFVLEKYDPASRKKGAPRGRHAPKTESVLTQNRVKSDSKLEVEHMALPANSSSLGTHKEEKNKRRKDIYTLEEAFYDATDRAGCRP